LAFIVVFFKYVPAQILEVRLQARHKRISAPQKGLSVSRFQYFPVCVAKESLFFRRREKAASVSSTVMETREGRFF
jgi:hypothetical protein